MPHKYSFRVGTGKQPQSWQEYVSQVEDAARSAPKKSHGPVENLIPCQYAYLLDNPKYEERRCKHISKKTGARCKRWSMRGADRCPGHGGYRQNPSHKATVRLFKMGEIDRQTAHKQARQIIYDEHRDTEAHRQARSAVKAAGAPLHAALILEGIRAFEMDDNGRAWRRWKASLKTQVTE